MQSSSDDAHKGGEKNKALCCSQKSDTNLVD